MGDEGVGEYDCEYDEVVDAEVGGVLADPGGGIGERGGSGEGSAVDELGPGAAVGERVAGYGGDAREEGAEEWEWVGAGRLGLLVRGLLGRNWDRGRRGHWC